MCNLRGIFLCRQEDLYWFYQAGADRIFPDYWEDFISQIPEAERGNLMQAYYERLTGANELAKMSCAKAWSTWEGRCATLRPNPEIVHFFAEPHRALSLARIEAHYFVNDAFIAPNQIIANAHKLKGIPGIIVHGRYDVVCPLDNAFALHQAWPGSELQIIRDAGHSAMEPSITDALVRATDQIADELYPHCPPARRHDGNLRSDGRRPRWAGRHGGRVHRRACHEPVCALEVRQDDPADAWRPGGRCAVRR